MARTWKMRVVTGHDSKPFSTRSLAREGWRALFFILDCGHRRRYGMETPQGGFAGDSDYGPGSHEVGDKARCYECAQAVKGQEAAS